MTLFPRSCGILLHPTSLPGRYGIGDLGENAYRFIDWLEDLGQSIWQVLPLGPTSYGDSPYQTLSAFAGNPNLISLDKLVDDGLLTESDLADTPDFPTDHVDFGWIIDFHDEKLNLAYQNFVQSDNKKSQQAFNKFSDDNQYWLDDFAIFAALKKQHDLRPWVEWKSELALRDEKALAEATEIYAQEIQEEKFLQWLFYKQWYELKYYANNKGVRLFGDLPIFVAHDSADVWANQHKYYLDETGNPTVIAGVPPDYFSPTGQRWGNPLYRWDVMKDDNYSWWLERFKAILSLVDYVRIDHFRGFEAYWEIPAEEETAIKGEWIAGPGHHLFKAVKDALGELPIIAEDLGVITEGVEKLRDDFNLPGMKVLQFAWGEPTNPFLPHNHPVNSVAYTGTHDNNTTLGWWQSEVDEGTINFMKDYLGQDIHDPVWTMARVGMRSSAHTFIMPMQDILGLGPEGRMNTPGQPAGNWTWRYWSVVKYSQWLIQYYENNSLIHENINNLKDAVNNVTPRYDTQDWEVVNIDLLRSIEQETPFIFEDGSLGNPFSHTLPIYDTQQYYELVSKYFQFGAGWRDYDNQVTNRPWDGTDISPLFQEGSRKAKKFNDQYRTAQLMLGFLLVNRIVSVVDAIITVKLSQNRHIKTSISTTSTQQINIKLWF